MTAQKVNFRFWTTLISAVSIIIGGVVFIGWVFDIPILTTILPNVVPMKINSAIGFILAGIALYLRREARPLPNRIATICALLIGLLGLVTLGEFIFNLDLGIDQLLIPDLTEQVAPPGRMSSASAFNFVLLSGILLIIPVRRWNRLSQALLFLMSAIASIAILGFLYGIESLYDLNFFNQIAFPSAALFLLLAVGCLAAQPNLTLWTWILADDAGGRMSRRLLPTALLLPVLLGWLLIRVTESDPLNSVVSIALLVLVITILFAGLVAWNAYSIHQRERALKAAEQHAFELAVQQEQIAMLAKFIENTSHDLRTPLSIINSSAYLAKHIADADQRAARLNQIEANVFRINRILDEFSLMAHLDMIDTLDLTPVALNPIVEAVIEPLRDSITAKGIQLQAELDPQSMSIRGDAEQLTKAIAEILDNAVRYTPQNGKITVSTRQNASIIIEIADTGPGIDMSHQPHIFDRYYKVNAARTSDGSQSGLGLSIAKRIIELHHGSIAVNSTVGEGTTFRISLPRNDA